MKRTIFALVTALFFLASFWVGYNLWQLDIHKEPPPIVWLSLLAWIFMGIIWLVAIGYEKQEQV